AARCDEFTPDTLKALSLWLSRNAGQESGSHSKDSKEKEQEEKNPTLS
ncbi:NUDIX hydrolase, partial [Cronobacter sakazakii]